MRFIHEGYLWFFIFVPFLFWSCLLVLRFRNKIREIFRTTYSIKKKNWRGTFVVLFSMMAFCSIVFALCQPQIQKLQMRPLSERVCIAVGIDISKSMLAEDVAFDFSEEAIFSISNRLNFARRFSLELVNKMDDEQVGIYFFAKNGVEMVPFTRDYGYIRYLLTYTDITQISVPGSNLKKAFITGQTMLENVDKSKVKAMIIITDGEYTANNLSTLKESISSIIAKDIYLIFIGIGKKENVFIPIRDGSEIIGYYEDDQGQYLQTKLEENVLQTLAKIANGDYFHPIGNDLTNIVQSIKGKINTISKKLPDNKISKSYEKTWITLTPLFLLLSLFFYSAYFLV